MENPGKLNPDEISRTLAELRKRMLEAVGRRGIVDICDEIDRLAKVSKVRCMRLARVDWGRRCLPWLHALVILVIAAVAILDPEFRTRFTNLAFSHGGQDHSWLIFPASLTLQIPAAWIFGSLVNLERSAKRKRALRYLHEIRSVIHIVDMHQLSKSPHQSLTVPEGAYMPLSPEKLLPYLRFCIDLLSLTSKVAALYAESSEDPLVIECVSDLGELTSNLSGEIWQRIGIIQNLKSVQTAI